MGLNQDWWMKIFQQKGAFWEHDGNPARPHAELRSGMHSSHFFNSDPVTLNDKVMQDVADDLVDRFIVEGFLTGQVDRVVGPIKLASLIAGDITDHRRRTCCFASPEEQGEGDDQRMVFSYPFRVAPGEVVLLCDNAITTGGIIERTAEACVALGAKVLPVVLVMVNTSGCFSKEGDRPILALIDLMMPKWKPADCPLCRQGSKALRLPKDPDNWAALNADY